MNFEDLLNQIQMCFSLTSTPIVDRFPIEQFELKSSFMKDYIRQVEHLIKYNGHSKDIQTTDILNKMKIFQEVCELLSLGIVTSDVEHALKTEVDWERIKHLYTVEMDKLATERVILNQFDNAEELTIINSYLAVTPKGLKIGKSMFDNKNDELSINSPIVKLFDSGVFIKRDFDALKEYLTKSQKELNRPTARKFMSRYTTYEKMLRDQAESTVVLLNAPILEKDSVKYVEFNGKDVQLSKTRYSNIYRGAYEEFSGVYKVFLDCTKEATI